MTPAQREALRPAFERWMSDNYDWPQAIERDANGHYILSTTASHWIAWQGAFESLGEPVAVFDVVNQGASKLLLTGAHPRIPAGRHPLYRLPQGE